MFVFSNIMDAVLKEDRAAVSRPDGLWLHLAVVKVLAWNSDRLTLPDMHGAKRAFSFIQVNTDVQGPKWDPWGSDIVSLIS